ncbi:MAG: hypothetical protein AAB573_00360 [Patescibacteria group bacterium]
MSEKADRLHLIGHDHGVLARRLEVLTDNWQKLKMTKAEWREYRAAVDQYLAYAEHVITTVPPANPMRQTVRTLRADYLSKIINFERQYGTWTKWAGTRTREWFLTLSSKAQKRIMYGAIAASLTYSYAMRTMALGPVAALFAVVAAFGGGKMMREFLHKQAESGGTNRITRWVLNTKKVESAEHELQAALAEYTDTDRHNGVRRIARAMAKKRAALLDRKTSIMVAGALTGSSSGIGTGVLVQDVLHMGDIGTARAATGHTYDDKSNFTSEYGPRSPTGLLELIGNGYNGWFVVRHGSTYDVYYVANDSQHTVHHALSNVSRLQIMGAGGVLELTQREFESIAPSVPLVAWLTELTGFAKPPEALENLYQMTPIENQDQLAPNYHSEIMYKISNIIADPKNGPLYQLPSTKISFDGKVFSTLFNIPLNSSEGLGSEQVWALAKALFRRIEHIDGFTLIGGEKANATFFIETDLLGGNGGLIMQLTDMYDAQSGGDKMATLAHEVSHAMYVLLGVSDHFKALPLTERAAIMEELYRFHDFLESPRAHAALGEYKGSPDALRLLSHHQSQHRNDEMFADAFAKLMTYPKLTRQECPQFAAFMQRLIAENPKMRSLIALS